MIFVCFWIRGRHASKLTEEEEDEEYLKEEEDGLSGTGNTRLVAQPSCKFLLSLFLSSLSLSPNFTYLYFLCLWLPVWFYKLEFLIFYLK